MARGRRLFTGLCTVALAGSIASASNAAAQETVLQRFPNRTNGVEPGGVILGPAGALYGTTFTYGPGRAGTVFRLTPPATGHGAWTLDTLYAFQDSAAGAYPAGTLAIDKAGAIYGTTTAGGKNFTGKNQGWGVVFKLSPPAKPGGAWKESVLFSFTKNQAGAGQSGLVMDSRGALYGASFSGGRKGFGTIFKLTPPAKTGAEWTVTTLHAFQDKGGSSPGGLVLDRDGALYGTTADGGSDASPQAGRGSIFKLTPPANGLSKWTFTSLHEFSGGVADGAGPHSLVVGPRGSVYGVTSGETRSVSSYASTVFKLTPSKNGQTGWKKTTLYTFTGSNDGISGTGLALSKTGSLFGTTSFGGTANTFGYGTVFRLDPPAAGRTAWTKRTLYSFQGGGKDGALPSGLVIDPAGTLYGATDSGGGGQCSRDFRGGFSVTGCGTVYQLTP